MTIGGHASGHLASAESRSFFSENQTASIGRRKVLRRALMASAATVALAAASPALAQNVHVLNGQTFTVTSNPQVINSLNIDPGGTVDLNNKTLIVTDNGVNTIWSGNITGVVNVGTILKTGTGTVTFADLTSVDNELHINGGKAVQTGTTNNIRYLTIGSDAGNGIFDISGGILNIAGPLPPNPGFQIGDFGGIGVVNQTAGAVNLTEAPMNIGNQGGNGTYNLSGGSITVTGASGVTIARTPNATRNSTGLLNIGGTGLFDMQDSVFVIGNNNPGGGPLTEGTLTQTGGIFRIQSGADLYLQGYNKGTYNLNGGVLEVGGTSLHGERYAGFGANGTGSYQFNMGGGTIKVIGSALMTTADLNATLTGGTSTIDTNGFGATWNGIFAGGGNLQKNGVGILTLNGVNTYTGATTVNGGTLALGAAGTVATSSGVNLATSGATFDITTGVQDDQGSVGRFRQHR